MQPLTPNERRQIERIKNLVMTNKLDRIGFQSAWGFDNEIVYHLPEDQELWLKVMSMVLETNEALSRAWAKETKGDVNPFRSDLR